MAGPARYDLSDDELDARRSELVAAVAAGATGSEVGVAWVPPGDPGADVVRTSEAQVFPDIAGFMTDAVESRCRFVAVVDLAQGAHRLVHAFRVSSLRFGPSGDGGDSVIGIPMVEEVVEANPPITMDEVVGHYRDRGIEMSDCVAVETNFRIAPDGTAPSGLRWSDYGYIAVFRELVRDLERPGDRGVFAHLNAAARHSLGAVGIEPEAFAGRSGLRSPAGQEGTYDDRYAPSFLHATEAHVQVFRDLEPVAAPEVDLGD